MKRIGFITDRLEMAQPLTSIIERFSKSDTMIVETLDRLAPDTPAIQKIRSLIGFTDLLFFFVDRGSPNIYYEIGLAEASNKPIVLAVSSEALVPLELAHFQYIVVAKGGFEQSAFEIFTAIERSLEMRTTKTESRPMPFHAYSPNTAFRDLYALPQREQAAVFEDWFASLARNVSEWKVIERESRKLNEGFDLLLWNSTEDPDLKFLGNPIPVELKTSGFTGALQLENLASKLKRQGLRSLIFATTATSRINAASVAKRVRKHKGFNIIPLERDDLIDVESPQDLYFAIKRQVLKLGYEE